MMPVEGHKDLVRDEKTNAIISVDKTGYETYMINRRINYDKQAEIVRRNLIETSDGAGQFDDPVKQVKSNAFKSI